MPAIATIVDSVGVLEDATPAEVKARLAARSFFWLDIFGGDEAARVQLLTLLGLEEADLVWAQRYGQAGRMVVAHDKVRAVTWLATSAMQLAEVHVLCVPACVVTVWNGPPTTLNEVREHFAERVGGFEGTTYHAVAILLQLLLGTLDLAISELDAKLEALAAWLEEAPVHLPDFLERARPLQKIQSIWASFDRYTSAVRLATVGIEAVSGMDPRGALELNDYADQVQDVEHRLHDRTRWLSSIMRDYSEALSAHQGEQINRLTLVSLIFLPLSFLTGFFGMNFNWLNNELGSPMAFFTLGLILPILSVVGTVVWLQHEGLIKWKRKRPRKVEPTPNKGGQSNHPE